MYPEGVLSDGGFLLVVLFGSGWFFGGVFVTGFNVGKFCSLLLIRF